MHGEEPPRHAWLQPRGDELEVCLGKEAAEVTLSARDRALGDVRVEAAGRSQGSGVRVRGQGSWVRGQGSESGVRGQGSGSGLRVSKESG